MTTCRKRAANVVHCARGNRAEVRFHRRIGSRKGLISLGKDLEFGHWEGDLLIFERPFGQANITSLVERKSLPRADQEPKSAFRSDHGQDHQIILTLAGIRTSKLHL